MTKPSATWSIIIKGLFKWILLRVRYILLIVSLLGSYSVNLQLPNEWSKSWKITYYPCNFIPNYKVAKKKKKKKNDGFLLNCTAKISTDCFVLEVSDVERSQNKIYIVSIIIPAGQEKKNKTLYITMSIWRNGSSYIGLPIAENLKKDKAIIMIKHKNYQSYQIWISVGFAQKGPVREFNFWNIINKGLCGVQFFEWSSNREATVFINFQNFFLKFK